MEDKAEILVQKGKLNVYVLIYRYNELDPTDKIMFLE